MTEQQHEHYNQLLNKRVEAQALPGYNGARIDYSHVYEIDCFYADAPGKPIAGAGSGAPKIRVTYSTAKDGSNRQMKRNGCIEKARVANMEVYSPLRNFDFRISISTEKPCSYIRCVSRRN